MKLMLMAASVRETCAVYQSQYNSLESRITPKLATAFRYLIYKHNTFLRHKGICALPNATALQWS